MLPSQSQRRLEAAHVLSGRRSVHLCLCVLEDSTAPPPPALPLRPCGLRRIACATGRTWEAGPCPMTPQRSARKPVRRSNTPAAAGGGGPGIGHARAPARGGGRGPRGGRATGETPRERGARPDTDRCALRPVLVCLFFYRPPQSDVPLASGRGTEFR